MIRLRVKSGYNGDEYQIDSPDRTMAAEWLLDMALLTMSNDTSAMYCPATILRAEEYNK